LATHLLLQRSEENAEALPKLGVVKTLPWFLRRSPAVGSSVLRVIRHEDSHHRSVRFCGSTLAECLMERLEGVHIIGIDNLMRPGAETNRMRIEQLGVQFIHGTCDRQAHFRAAEVRLGDRRGAIRVCWPGFQGGSSRRLLSTILRRLATCLSTAGAQGRAGIAEQQPGVLNFCAGLDSVAGGGSGF